MDNFTLRLTEKLKEYAYNPQDPELNYDLAIMYENLGQTASAITFFLRCAERTPIKELAYECLLRLSACYNRQGNRNHTVITVLKHAVALLPKRPEAYFIISRTHERGRNYVEGYTYASMGLENADFNLPPLRTYVEYPGKYGIIFEKAICGFWWGRNIKSRRILAQLTEDYWDIMDPIHRASVESNLKTIGAGPRSVTFKDYNQSMHDRLKFKFKDSDKVDRNFSQLYQDMFVLAAHNGKRNGTFLEIGGYLPWEGNNTALLETRFGWTGTSIEIVESWANQYRAERKTNVICADAVTADYNKILSEVAVNGIVDYLQVDCDPAKTTFEILLTIPFDKYKFGVVTYEHDYFIDMTRSYREKARKYLEALGYVLVVGNVGPTDFASIEDWWVHPDIIDADTIAKLKNTEAKVVEIDKFMLND